MVGQWTFEQGEELVDRTGNFGDLTLNGNATVSGGAQSGNVNSNQTRTLNPGTYVIDGGDLSIGSQARVTGNGVTFILTSKTAANNPNSIGQIKMNGGATLNLTAPSSGTYQGVLMGSPERLGLLFVLPSIRLAPFTRDTGALGHPHDQSRPRGRQRHDARTAVEQGDAERRLEPRHRLRHARLRQAECGGGGGKAAAVRDGDETGPAFIIGKRQIHPPNGNNGFPSTLF